MDGREVGESEPESGRKATYRYPDDLAEKNVEWV